ncbi:MAG: MFS transporter [Alphaproteobacteria bacterium]|nr:MFS transporter [Alphaproteobacteria bacterium]
MSLSPANGPAAAPSPPESTSWALVLLLVGAGVVAALHVGKAPPALPPLRADLAMSLTASGWCVSLFNVIAAALGMLAGLAADRAGHRRLMLTGLGAMTAASLAGSLAPDAEWLLVSRVVEGSGFLCVVVAAPTLILAATAERDRRLALGLWSTYLPAGAALMLAGAPWLLPQLGWRGVWAGTAAASLAYLVGLALVAGRLRSAPSPTRARNAVGAVASTVGAPGPVLLGLCFGLYTVQWMAVIGFLPTYLAEQRGHGPAMAALVTAAVVAVNIPGNILAGWLLHRGVGRGAVIGAGACGMAVAAPFIFGGHESEAWRLAGCAMFSCLGGMVPAGVLAGVPRHAPRPELTATTNGLAVQGSNLGNLAGPPALAAVASGAGGWTDAPLLTIAAAGGLLVAGLALGRRERAARRSRRDEET